MQRRGFLSGIGTAVAAGALVRPALAQSANRDHEGAFAAKFGVRANAMDDQSARFQAMLNGAAETGRSVFLPGGTFVISDVQLPDRCVLIGVPGHTTLVQGGGSGVFRGSELQAVHLEDLTIHGARRPGAGDVDGLIDLRGVLNVTLRNCDVAGSNMDALYLERSGGAVSGCTLSDAARFGVFSVEGLGVRLDGNTVHSCGNGGIVVHRWEPGPDNTSITHNRIFDIAATEGGTGQWGNGINLFKTHDNLVSGNVISNCAFSAFRANSTERITVSNNLCKALGETAIYAEFAFKDAIITGNQIDGAANGISVTNFNNGGRGATVANNIIRNIHLNAPYEGVPNAFGTGISVEADTSVTGNVIEDCALYGINAGWGPYLRDCVVSSNVIRRAETGIGVSAAQGAGMALITGNTINARRGSIIAHEWAKPVSEDLALNAGKAPANIIVENNRVT